MILGISSLVIILQLFFLCLHSFHFNAHCLLYVQSVTFFVPSLDAHMTSLPSCFRFFARCSLSESLVSLPFCFALLDRRSVHHASVPFHPTAKKVKTLKTMIFRNGVFSHSCAPYGPSFRVISVSVSLLL